MLEEAGIDPTDLLEASAVNKLAVLNVQLAQLNTLTLMKMVRLKLGQAKVVHQLNQTCY